MKFGYNFSWFQHKILHKPDPPTYTKKHNFLQVSKPFHPRIVLPPTPPKEKQKARMHSLKDKYLQRKQGQLSL